MPQRGTGLGVGLGGAVSWAGLYVRRATGPASVSGTEAAAGLPSGEPVGVVGEPAWAEPQPQEPFTSARAWANALAVAVATAVAMALLLAVAAPPVCKGAFICETTQHAGWDRTGNTASSGKAAHLWSKQRRMQMQLPWRCCLQRPQPEWLPNSVHSRWWPGKHKTAQGMWSAGSIKQMPSRAVRQAAACCCTLPDPALT